MCTNACLDLGANRLILFGESAASVGLDKNWTFNLAGRLLPDYERSRNFEMYVSRNDGVLEPQIMSAPNVNWTWEARMLVLARRFSAYNMGHVLAETAIPIVRMVIGRHSNSTKTDAILVTSSFRNKGVLYLNDSCSDDRDRWVANGPSGACTNMSESFLFPIVNETIQRDHRSSDAVRCFDRASFGHSMFNALGAFRYGVDRDMDLAAEQEARRAYRDIIYRHNGLDPPAPASPGNGPATITVIVKTGKRSFSNYGELQQYLHRDWHKICGVETPTGIIDLSTSPLPEVLQVLSKTTLLITPPGSNSWISIFLPDNATMIVGSFCQLDPGPACSSWEVEAFHRDTPSLTTLVYTPDNISDEIVPRLGYYDIRLRMDVLDGLVRQALDPWVSQC